MNRERVRRALVADPLLKPIFNNVLDPAVAKAMAKETSGWPLRMAR
jgi:hypothetical protein